MRSALYHRKPHDNQKDQYRVRTRSEAPRLVSCGVCPSVIPLVIEDWRVLIVLPSLALFSKIVAENNFRPPSGRQFQHKLHSMYRYFSSHALVALALIYQAHAYRVLRCKNVSPDTRKAVFFSREKCRVCVCVCMIRVQKTNAMRLLLQLFDLLARAQHGCQ